MDTAIAKRDGRAGRTYTIDGRTYPSVTTILTVIGKPALVNWAANVERELVIQASADLYEDVHGTPKLSRPAWILTMQGRLGKLKAHQKELAKAGEIGTQAHKLIEWNLKAKLCKEAGPCPSISDRATWAFMAWEDWAKSVQLKPLLVEQVVYSRTFGYAGTLDLFAEVNGLPTVVDWKTGKAVYAEAHLQNAAYRNALREMGHGDAVQGIIVRLPKVETDPEFEAVLADEERESFHKFLNSIELWKWAQKKDEEYQRRKEELSEKAEKVAVRG